MFCLIKQLQKLSTAKDVTDCGLTQIIDVYFTRHLHSKGLNLDGNLLKKKALVDFIFCLPVILEATMKMRHIRNSFVEAGKIDEETGTVPALDKLIGRCRGWKSCSKDIGVAKKMKDHCRK